MAMSTVTMTTMTNVTVAGEGDTLRLVIVLSVIVFSVLGLAVTVRAVVVGFAMPVTTAFYAPVTMATEPENATTAGFQRSDVGHARVVPFDRFRQFGRRVMGSKRLARHAYPYNPISRNS
jgi:hypothetical protein